MNERDSRMERLYAPSFNREPDLARPGKMTHMEPEYHYPEETEEPEIPEDDFRENPELDKEFEKWMNRTLWQLAQRDAGNHRGQG